CVTWLKLVARDARPAVELAPQTTRHRVPADAQDVVDEAAAVEAAWPNAAPDVGLAEVRHRVLHDSSSTAGHMVGSGGRSLGRGGWRRCLPGRPLAWRRGSRGCSLLAA